MNSDFKRLIATGGLIVTLAAGTGQGNAQPFEAHTKLSAEKAVSGEPMETLPMGSRVAIGMINFFIRYISPVDGERCPCYPTCSDYARRAIRKHGLAMGFVMAFDRLIHEADEIHRVPQVPIFGIPRYYDPVENNDFWWYRPEASMPVIHSPSESGP